MNNTVQSLRTQLDTARRERDEALAQIEGLLIDLADKSRAFEMSNADFQQFTYSVSHDLLAPLRAITGCAQLLELRAPHGLDADAQELLTHITTGAHRIRALILALLDYSRVGTAEATPMDVQVRGELDKALLNLRAEVKDSAAHIQVGHLHAVNADPAQLVLLFQHLISNAIKYRGEAPPQVHITAHEQDPMVRFEVQDRGIGIDPAQAERVFDVFQRLHSQTEYPGTGIGLAICRRIVERHRGRIRLEQPPSGEGCTFSFTLPKAIAC